MHGHPSSIARVAFQIGADAKKAWMESSGDGRGTRPWLGAWMCPTVDRSCLVLPTDGMDGLSTGVAEKLAWESLFDA